MRQQNILENKESGYIALISAVIIGAILTVIVYVLSFTSFSSRINILGTEFKEKSSGLADACVDVVIIRLQGNESYDPSGDTVRIDDGFCNILSVSPTGSWPKTVEIQSKYPEIGTKISYTNLEVQLSKPLDEVVVDSWKEVDTLP